MIPDEWTVMQGYPIQRVKGREGSIAIKYRTMTAPTQETLIGLIGASYDGLSFSSAEAAPNEKQTWWAVTVTFQNEAASDRQTRDDGTPIFTVEDSGQELPVDLLKQNESPYFANYKTKWNYHLAGVEGSTTPAWWTTSTDTTTDDDSEYRWVKEPDSLPEGWVIVEPKTKRLESVPVPSPVILEQRWYRSYRDAASQTKDMFKRKTPDRVFNYADLEWLVVGCTISPDGRRWLVEKRYQGAEEWDSDIFEAAT
jgi:hypothetical protein